MAEITINGHSLGKTWSVPFILQVNNRYLRKKHNQLIIRVTNFYQSCNLDGQTAYTVENILYSGSIKTRF